MGTRRVRPLGHNVDPVDPADPDARGQTLHLWSRRRVLRVARRALAPPTRGRAVLDLGRGCVRERPHRPGRCRRVLLHPRPDLERRPRSSRSRAERGRGGGNKGPTCRCGSDDRARFERCHEGQSRDQDDMETW